MQMFHIEFSFGELNMKLVMPESKIKDLLNLISGVAPLPFNFSVGFRDVPQRSKGLHWGNWDH